MSSPAEPQSHHERRRFDDRRAFPGGLPGSKRSPCLGCDEPVRSARHAHVQIAGTKDGSWLALIDARPALIPVNDPDQMPTEGLFLLGFAHRQCADRARERLMDGTVELPEDLPTVVLEDVSDDPPENLDLPPRPDQCPFCQGTGPLTDEHIWPVWMIQEFRQINRGAPFTIGKGDGPARPTRSLDLTVPVCDECNNRWLSVLETDVAPILRPMIHGTDCDLTPAEQRFLATWAAKTAMTLNLLDPATAFIPLGYYHELRQQRRALPSMVVWIGAYSGKRWATWAHQRPLHIGDPRPERPNACLTTFTAFRVVFQVLGHFTSGGATLKQGRLASLALHAIWPPRRETLRWPRDRLAFGDDALDELAESFSE